MTTYRVAIPDLLVAKTRRALSPNGRPHWARKAAAAAVVRRGAYTGLRAAMTEAGWQDPLLRPQRVTLHIDAAFPGAALLDSDNIWAMVKSARDGCADWLNPFASDARRDAGFEQGAVRLKSARKATWFFVDVEVSDDRL